jgi:hypothetical protein
MTSEMLSNGMAHLIEDESSPMQADSEDKRIGKRPQQNPPVSISPPKHLEFRSKSIRQLFPCNLEAICHSQGPIINQ